MPFDASSAARAGPTPFRNWTSDAAVSLEVAILLRFGYYNLRTCHGASGPLGNGTAAPSRPRVSLEHEEDFSSRHLYRHASYTRPMDKVHSFHSSWQCLV